MLAGGRAPADRHRSGEEPGASWSPAYDDAPGVTADFNRNVLRVLNRSLNADFDLDGFAHVALWDADHEWVEMRLRARWPMRVTIPDLDLVVDFAAGEEIRTEVSAKFRRDGVERELADAGFRPRPLVDRPGRPVRPLTRTRHRPMT